MLLIKKLSLQRSSKVQSVIVQYKSIIQLVRACKQKVISHVIMGQLGNFMYLKLPVSSVVNELAYQHCFEVRWMGP